VNQDTDRLIASTPAATGGRKIRVAFAITDLDVGGAERALVELATRLDRDTFDVRVWGLMVPHADAARSLVPLLRAAGVPVATLDAQGVGGTLRVLRRLTAEWRDWRPDIVQTFLFHANILGRIAAWRAGVPHVVSGIRVAERRSHWRLRIDRWTDRLVDRHVCVSQAVADFSRTRGGLDAEKLLVVPNGIDASRCDAVQPITPVELGLPAGRKWITYVGRLDPQKSLEWLLSEARSWLVPLADHDLVIVGDGPLRARLESLVRERNLVGRVHLTGWRADVPAILAASDLLVLPSQWEGMPNVVLEAMAARRPVLTTDVEGVRELLGEDAEPQIATRGDAGEWTVKLRALVGNRQLALLLGERNRRRVEEHFTLQSVAAAYEQLYLSLVRPLDPMRTR
jgi:glycosyltransferase involved in cell wall biosynthesis